MPLVTVGIALGVWVALLVSEIVYAQRLTRYRIDVSEGQPFFKGTSWFLQWNPTNPANYVPEARPKLRLLYALATARVLATVAALAIAARYVFLALG